MSCPGQFTLGIGIGWSAKESAALGVPFAGRGRRTAWLSTSRLPRSTCDSRGSDRSASPASTA
jgi:hypothetical protein